MRPDNIETLVAQAHQIFKKTSIHEVIDMDREAATITQLEFYEAASATDIEKYLDVLELLKGEMI